MKILTLEGDVGYEITAKEIKNEINIKSKESLKVFVNSPGGSVIEAFEIFNIFKGYKGSIEFVINGMAASAMSYIIMSGDKISAFKNSIFMAHRAWTIGIGDANELRKEADLLDGLDNIIAESYSDRLGETRENILEMMSKELWLIGWEKLTEAGIIDNVIDSPEDIDEEMEIEEISIDEAAARTKIKLTKSRLEKENVSYDLNKIAAYIKEFSPVEKPVENKLNEEGKKMTLQEFLKANPEAKAEYDQALINAEAKGKADGIVNLADEVEKESARIYNILKIERAAISDIAINAIKEKSSYHDYLEMKATAQKDVRTETNKVDFGNLAAKQTPAEQAPDVAKEKSKAEIDAEFDAKSLKLAEQLKLNGGI